MTYLDKGRCGYRQRTIYVGDEGPGILWECVRQEHGPRTVRDAQGREVGKVPDHWFRKVEEGEDGP